MRQIINGFKYTQVLLSSCILCCSTLWADGLGSANVQKTPFTLSAAGGVNWIQSIRSPYLPISAYEEDYLRVNNTPTEALWKVGVAISPSIENLRLPYIKRLVLEANVYYTHAALKGTVWEYSLPQFANFTFKAPFSSTRLMLDAKPYLYDFHNYSLYAILGVGAAWNSMGYYEQVVGAGVDPTSRLNLHRNTTTNIAYDVGVGIRKPLFKQLDVFVEYLYSYFGEAVPSRNQIEGSVALVAPPAFKLNSQGILLGINWAI